MLVPRGPVAVDRKAAACSSLRDAVRFPEGKRYDADKACYAVEAEGLAAYALWRDEVAAGTASGERLPPRGGGRCSAGDGVRDGAAAGAWDAAPRRDAAPGIDASLAHEREAVDAIRAALARQHTQRTTTSSGRIG